MAIRTMFVAIKRFFKPASKSAFIFPPFAITRISLLGVNAAFAWLSSTEVELLILACNKCSPE
jgi:hypothetical protein